MKTKNEDVALVSTWDSVSDTVVAAFKAGSNNGAGGGSVDSNGGLLRQWIHGGLGYDDPVETTVMAGTAVDRLYPIYDEAGAGNLQVLLNRNAEVVSRNVVNDPYVAQDLTIGGAAVDNIAISARRDDKSELTSVEITLHLTEDVAAATVVAGTRLAVLRSDGSVLRTSTVQAQGSETDIHAIRWTLTAAEWASLVAADRSTTPAILSIAVTKDLRAATWATDVPVLPAPEWATQTKPLFTSTDYPVESRESLASLSSFLAAIPAGTSKSTTIYEVETLSLLGSSDRVSEIPALLTSNFQAHPLTSRLGHLDYVRARWLHRESGTWMTPDPLSYRDSSNLYAFAGKDPVNGRDPSGRASDANSDPSVVRLKERERAETEARLAAGRSQCRSQGRTAESCLSDAQRLILHRLGDKESFVIHGVGSERFPKTEPIILVTGVRNDLPQALRHAERLSTDVKSQVDLVWNATQSFSADIVQTGLVNKLDIPDQTTKLTIELMRTSIIHLRSGQHVHVFGHSQGAAIVASALNFLTIQERSRIDLVTFGGAAWTYPPGVHSRKNVVNILDFYVADWAGNGLPTFGAFDPNVDYTLFTDDQFHGFNGYWSTYWDWRDPAKIRTREMAEERRRKERLLRNWEKR